jgi:hypothetical protein
VRHIQVQSISGVALPCVVMAVLFTSIGWLEATSARQATPVVTPTAVICDVVPLTVEEILAAAAVPEAETEIWIDFPAGEPADPATKTEITAVVRKLEACINTGDPLLAFALFTDDFFRVLPLTEETMAEVRGWETAAPNPAPDDKRQVLIGPWEVRILPDGRVAAAVLFNTSVEPVAYPEATKALFFVRRDGEWQIETWTESVKAPDCELPVQVEYAIGPPPDAQTRAWPALCEEHSRHIKPKKRRNRAATPSSGPG